MLFYIRWPNGDHTIASAPSLDELEMLLDEQGNAADALCKRLQGRRGNFAIDFKPTSTSLEFNCAAYESATELYDYCIALNDSDLTPGSKFFRHDR